jgi:hypothetical protein
MMGRQATKHELFVMISLDEYVPEDHLLRAVDRYLDLSEFRLAWLIRIAILVDRRLIPNL